MRVPQTGFIIASGAAVLAVLTVCLFLWLGSSGGHTGAKTLPAAIKIDQRIGVTFAPAPGDAAPKLTAQQALDRFELLSTHRNAHAKIPSYVAAYLGLLTWPVGPDCGAECRNLIIRNGIAYSAFNELTYGYSVHRCPASRNPNVRTLPPNPCIEWTFLNANTGKLIYITSQT